MLNDKFDFFTKNRDKHFRIKKIKQTYFCFTDRCCCLIDIREERDKNLSKMIILHKLRISFKRSKYFFF